jgi:hypothetical protein
MQNKTSNSETLTLTPKTYTLITTHKNQPQTLHFKPENANVNSKTKP